MSKKSEIHPAAWAAIGAGTLAAFIFAKKVSKSPEEREQVLGHLHQGLDRANEVTQELMQEGRERANTLQEDARNLTGTLASKVMSTKIAQRQPHGISVRESAAAALAIAVLTTGVASYSQWRREKRAVTQPGASSTGDQEQLEELTVVELRRKASEQEIDGRSSMNKQDLIEALEDEQD